MKKLLVLIGSTHKNGRTASVVKKAVIAYSQGNPSLDLQSYYDVNAQFFKKFGLDTIDTIIYSGHDEKIKEEVMTRALECGKKLFE